MKNIKEKIRMEYVVVIDIIVLSSTEIRVKSPGSFAQFNNIISSRFTFSFGHDFPSELLDN